MSDPPVVIPLNPDPNSKEAIEFYRWLGICVGSWAFIDRRLYELFHYATKLDDRQSALMFYRNRAFNNRLRLVDDALKMALPQERYKEEWASLRQKVEDLSNTRNIFAHHPTKRLGTAKDGKPFDIYSIYIEPYERVLNHDYPGLRGKDELTATDLTEHSAEVGMLELELRDFGRGLLRQERGT
jgi:hypothetical protein